MRVALIAVCLAGFAGCDESTIIVEDQTPDVITIIEEDSTPDVVTVIMEDNTPDVIQEFYSDAANLPVFVWVDQGGAPPMPKKYSDLTVATTVALADIFAIAQSGTSKQVAFEHVPLPTNWIGGLICSTGTDIDHDVDVAVGSCRDSTDVDNMRLTSAITKQLDAAWVVGTNQGGIDAGSVAADTLYAIWLIKRSDTGVVDVLFSTSFSAPTMPTNYDRRRLIGAIKTDASVADIIPFLQSGDEFVYVGGASRNPPQDLNSAVAASDTFVTATLASIPPLCKGRVTGRVNNATSANGAGYLKLRTKGATGYTVNRNHWVYTENGSTFDIAAAVGDILVDASQQIEWAAFEPDGTATAQIQVHGFTMLTRREPQ